jgi:uncharacterized RDD family membrane protein YckC
LSVRRANPAGRSRPHAPLPEELSLDLAAELEESEKGPLDVFIPEPLPGAPAAAGIVRRIGAGIIDLLVLGAIDATVVYLTLRLCELTVNDWRTLPFAPLIAFLLLLSGGYFVLFAAAGGQTIGKMATGIRVIYAPITATAHPRVSFGTAVVRTVACLGSVLALGAGFLPVLFNDDRRAFHDRIAETRVVLA